MSPCAAVAGALFLRKARVSALAWLKKGVLLALLICAVVATDWAQKGTSRAPALTPATREAVADSVRLSLSWPEGFFSGGERIDVFCATNLICPAVLLPERDTSGAGWRWCARRRRICATPTGTAFPTSTNGTIRAA